MLKNVKLQEFMDRKGLTQQQLADAIGVSRSVIGKWNTQVSDVTRENCAKLLLAGMTIEEMFGDDVAECVKKAILEEAGFMASKTAQKPDSTPIDYQDPKFQEAVKKALLDIEERKKRGLL